MLNTNRNWICSNLPLQLLSCLAISFSLKPAIRSKDYARIWLFRFSKMYYFFALHLLRPDELFHAIFPSVANRHDVGQFFRVVVIVLPGTVWSNFVLLKYSVGLGLSRFLHIIPMVQLSLLLLDFIIWNFSLLFGSCLLTFVGWFW